MNTSTRVAGATGALLLASLMVSGCQTQSAVSTHEVERGEAQFDVKPSGIKSKKAEPIVAKKAVKPVKVKPKPAFGKKVAKAKKPATGKRGGARRKLDPLIAKYARKHGVPLKLAHAVITVESSYRENALGAAGEVGLMQVKPATARLMGFTGKTKSLYVPEINLNYGMKYLGEAHRLGGGQTCGTILKYNAGHGATRMNKISSAYCQKINGILARS